MNSCKAGGTTQHVAKLICTIFGFTYNEEILSVKVKIEWRKNIQILLYIASYPYISPLKQFDECVCVNVAQSDTG